MTGPLYHIGRFCTRHHWAVIVAWIAVVAGLVAYSHTLGDKTSDNLNLDAASLAVLASREND